ncbi:MAG TPA: thermonuclease family protein [Devosia sp.]|nr:thermonuclease family protein [Devosia sp.]
MATASACEGLRDGPKGVVTEIVDGDTVLLDNGLVVRLVGIQAPRLALGREGFDDWPMGDEAKAALAAIVLKKPIVLAYGGAETDRYGRSLAQVFVTGEGEPVWVQAAMLKVGMARAYSFADNRTCMPELLAAEGRARLERLGIWGDSFYSVRRADRPAALLEREGHYELVEGRVLLAEASQGAVFLNFGRVWKEDFTAVIDRGGLKLFAEAGVDPTKLGGALVRVRGWVDIKDGPRIELTHPEQIEILATP